ncbi:MAG: SpoIIE family protein phosphatase [Oscillospiraceae bacterium]|nr:SpoIIE family protein phosphatase [Oscillospiraceae bacterium]
MNDQEFSISEGGEKIRLSALGRSALLQAVHFGAAALTASASSAQYFSPLGIAFCSGTEREYTLFSCLGAMLGYIVSNEYLSAFRYVMALIIVYILKIYANSFKKLRGKVIIQPVISVFATAATGIIVTVTSSFDMQQVFLRIAESVTAFGGAYFFAAAVITAKRLRIGEHITHRELTALIISVMILILSMRRLSFFGVSPAGAVCSYIVLSSSYIFREYGGAMIGTGASLGFAMTGADTPTAFCYSAAGLFSGIFSYSGRVLCAMAYIFSYGATFLYFGGGESLAPLAETAIASVLFILTPQSVFLKTKSFLSLSSLSGDGTAVKNMMVSRLKMAKEAVVGMSETVSRVSEILREKAAPDTTGIYLRVRDSVCTGCATFDRCWKSGFPGTANEFDAVIEEIRRSGQITPSFAPASLQNRCIRIMSLCDSFNKNYSSYSARLASEGRINEMRKITADQFETVCDMIDDLLYDFEDGVKPLGNRAEDLKSSLSDIGVDAFVNCYEDGKGNMLISLSLNSDCNISDEDIKACIEKETEKEFAAPASLENSSERILLFWETPEYFAECDYFQLSGESGEICGDCFDSFFDGRGNFIAILSDGMGTGGRAAIDGAMASSLFSRLIVAGFSFPCALRLVNSAMLVKSRDESLATLDILKINLYTGQAAIYKAGASVSLMKRRGKVSEIKKSAMPIGILRQAEFATVRGGLHEDDLIIMMSDGAADSSIDEIKKFVMDNKFSHDLPQKLCVLAKSRNVGRCDDITVAAVKIKRNVES